MKDSPRSRLLLVSPFWIQAGPDGSGTSLVLNWRKGKAGQTIIYCLKANYSIAVLFCLTSSQDLG